MCMQRQRAASVHIFFTCYITGFYRLHRRLRLLLTIVVEQFRWRWCTEIESNSRESPRTRLRLIIFFLDLLMLFRVRSSSFSHRQHCVQLQFKSPRYRRRSYP